MVPRASLAVAVLFPFLDPSCSALPQGVASEDPARGDGTAPLSIRSTPTGATPTSSSPATSSGSFKKTSAPHVVDITGPLLNDVLADPTLLKDGDNHYAYATQHDKVDINVPYAMSKNGLRGDWQAGAGDAMPRNTSGCGEWTINPHGNSGLWNPDVSRLVSDVFTRY